MKHRDDLGREKFLEKVWEWKEKHGGIIIQQLKKLGASCDWTRERFTMDPEYSRACSAFSSSFTKKGLIYRGKRMVNWDPVARTALSDEEVEMTEEQGICGISSIRWRRGGLCGRGHDAARNDAGRRSRGRQSGRPRYQNLHGKKVLLPLVNKTIPIIVDELGGSEIRHRLRQGHPGARSGDYEMAQRHHLPLTVVIGPNGAMTETAGADFAGSGSHGGAQGVVEKLEALGLGAQGGEVHSSRRLRPAQQCADRALSERAMVFALSVGG
jgi:valyl-tRNA synthetase